MPMNLLYGLIIAPKSSLAWSEMFDPCHFEMVDSLRYTVPTFSNTSMAETFDELSESGSEFYDQVASYRSWFQT
jgi:hypothetical protein